MFGKRGDAPAHHPAAVPHAPHPQQAAPQPVMPPGPQPQPMAPAQAAPAPQPAAPQAPAVAPQPMGQQQRQAPPKPMERDRSEEYYDVKTTVFNALIDTIDLTQLARLDAEAASILLGQCVDYEVGNVFDPAYTMICKLAKRHLPTPGGRGVKGGAGGDRR